MDVQPQKNLVKLRTFAQDMERARLKSGMPLPENSKADTSHKAAAPSTPTIVAESAPRKVEAPKEDKHIPAFHELQKKSSSAPTIKEPNIVVGGSAKPAPAAPAPKRTVSVRAKKRDLKEAKHVGGGTIITDSKAEGFKLIPSVLKSIDDWIKEIKKSFKKKTAPKYVITDTERRRGVIQKATSKTGSIFTADNETLKEEIRRRQATAGASNDVAISWSPNTEAGYALLESDTPKPVTSNVTVAFKKQSTPVAVSTPEVPVPLPKPAPTPSVPPPPVIVEPTVVPEIVPEPAPVIPEPVIEVEPVVETEMPVAEAAPAEYELTTPEEHYKIRSLGDIARINTNLLSIGIIGAIAGLVIFIVLVRALLGFMIPSETRLLIEPLVPLLETTSTADVSIGTLSAQTILTATQEASSVGQVTELRFVDETGQPIATETLLPLLGFNALPNLNRTISDVRVVIRGPERGLVFTVTDSTSALGSLLASEDALVPALASTLATTAYDPSGEFDDTTLGIIDVRIYTTSTGDTQLVYGFVDENTVVITGNEAFFTTILGGQ